MKRFIILFCSTALVSFSLFAADIKKCGKDELELCRAAGDCKKCICTDEYLAGKLKSCKKAAKKCVDECVKKKSQMGQDHLVDKCDDPNNEDKSVPVLGTKGEIGKKTRVTDE